MDKINIKILLVIAIYSCIILGLQNCTNDVNKNLGNGYTYRNEGGDIKEIFYKIPSEGGEIPSTIINYNYNQKFIIAKQRPKLPQDPLYEKEYHYNRGDTAIYYWLIVKSENKVYGPLDIYEFNQLRLKEKVPKDLIFKTE